jgi:hypothetical protein
MGRKIELSFQKTKHICGKKAYEKKGKQKEKA